MSAAAFEWPQPPANIEAERGLLGAILLNNAAYQKVSGFVLPEHFANAVHGRIYAAIGELISRGAPANPVMIRHTLGDDATLVPLGGTAAYVAKLIASAITVVNAEYYGRAIVETAQRRALFEAGLRIIETAFTNAPIDEIMNHALAELPRIGESNNSAQTLWVDADPWCEADMPRRPWIAPGYALRGAVTILTGPPSAMKSSLMLAWACALALGRDYGDFRPREAEKALIYDVEDDREEQRRRLSATLRQFDATPADIHNKVIRTGPSGVGTLFAIDKETGAVRETSAMTALRALLRKHEPDLLIVDPLAELHTEQENDNTALRNVIANFRALAGAFNMAVVVLHHTRKGTITPGDPDAARGASSIIGAGRVALTLCPMSEDEAEELGMPKDRKTRSSYIRLDDARQSYAAIGDARWFEKVVYALDNGEHVPAAVPWQPPDMWAGISTSVTNQILDAIEAGPSPGRRYSSGTQTDDRAAWKVVVAHVPSLDEKQARKVIMTWLKNQTLRSEPYNDLVLRKERTGLYVNPQNRPGVRK